MYTEDDLLPFSAFQHLLFCDRQCALIHIEQVWVENLYTAEGRIMYERVDSGRSETRGDVRLSFSLPLRSLRLGLAGKADVVEFQREQGDELWRNCKMLVFG
jgi:CRISPR-associated exonuclease Cas4